MDARGLRETTRRTQTLRVAKPREAVDAKAPPLHAHARMLEALGAGLLLGLLSAPHCALMCGPLAAFASASAGRAEPLRMLEYQGGRLVGYGAVGATCGLFGRGLLSIVPMQAEAVFSVVLALVLLAAAMRAWPKSALVSIGRRPRRASLVGRIGPWIARAPRTPALLGVASALLPCGVLFSGALLAAGTGGAVSGAIAMVGLTLGSGAALVVGSIALGRVELGSGRAAARGWSALLVVGALALLARPLLVSSGSCH